MPDIEVPNSRPNATQSEPVLVSGANARRFHAGIREISRNPKLRRQRIWKTYSEIISQIPIIQSCIDRYNSFICNTQFNLEPKEETPEAEEASKRMEEIIFGMDANLNLAASHLAKAFFYGHSEVEWVRSMPMDNTIYLTQLSPIDPATIEAIVQDNTGNVIEFQQRRPGPNGFSVSGRNADTLLRIDARKCLKMCYQTRSNAADGELGALFRIAYTALQLLDLEKKQGIGYERDFIGQLFAYVPRQEIAAKIKQSKPNITQEELEAEVNKQTKPLQDFLKYGKKTDERTFITLDSAVEQSVGPDGTKPVNVRKWELKSVEGEPGPHETMLMNQQLLERRIATAFGCHDLLLGDQGQGSLALSDNQFSNFRTIVDSLLHQVEREFNYLIKVFGALNGMDQMTLPRMKAEAPKEIPVETKASVLNQMSMTDLDLHAENSIRADLGLEPITEEEKNAMAERKMQEEESRMAMQAKYAPKPNASGGMSE